MAVPASAQTVPKVELSGGYQFLNCSLRGANEAMPALGQVLAGGINGSVKASASATIPGQAPITFEEEDSGTDLAIQAGGGVNFGLTDTIGLRAGADYLHVFAEGDGAHLFRFHAGVAIGR